jgi:hypothetical protein
VVARSFVGWRAQPQPADHDRPIDDPVDEADQVLVIGAISAPEIELPEHGGLLRG